MKFLASTVATATALFSGSASALAGVCAINNEFCFQMAAPTTTTSSGSGNVYFNMQAVDSYSWVGVGTGNSMSGSNMFIMYADGNGNVTVSPRKASGHNMPTLDSSITIEMLEGSQITGGVMMANFKCTNCAGNFDFSSSSAPFIFGWKQGSPINGDASARISQHDDYTRNSLALNQAEQAQDSNPFPTTVGASSGSTGTSSGTGSTATGQSSSSKNKINLLLIHGVVMAVAFIFLYPVGAILMPLVGKWFVHAGVQLLAFIVMWVGFGLGYKKANDSETLFKDSHTILGTIVCCAMIVQPALGFLHHRYFKKHQSRGPISHAHIWYGRIIMLVGIINGGLGLDLAGASNTFVVAYSVIAVILGIAYMASAYVGQMRRNRRAHEKSGSYTPPAPPQGYRPPPSTTSYKPVPATNEYQNNAYNNSYGSRNEAYGGSSNNQQQYGGRSQYNNYGSYR